MTNIILIEDDPVFSSRLTMSLKKHKFDSVAITDVDTEDYLQYAGNADLFIVDYHLGSPNENGLDVCNKIRLHGDTPIIMLTSEHTPETLVACLNAGAEQYIEKPCRTDELIARINVVLRAKHGLNTRSHSGVISEKRIDGFLLSRSNRTLSYEGKSTRLTQREVEIADIFTSNEGKIASRESLHQELFGLQMPTFSRSVDVIVARLRKKIRAITNKIEIISVPNQGYRLSLPENDDINAD